MKSRSLVSRVAWAVTSLAVLALAALMPADSSGQDGAKSKGGPFPQQLTLFDREGQAVLRLGEPGVFDQPVFSPDGTRLAVARTDPASRRLEDAESWRSTFSADLLLFDAATGRSALVASGPELVVHGWSPDGRQILFSSRRENRAGVFRIAADGTGDEELLYRPELGTIVNFPDWSPDGRFLLFTTGGVLVALPLTGDREAVELLRDEYERGRPRLSPDGRWLLYWSEESGRSETYVQAFDPSSGRLSPVDGKWPVSQAPAGGDWSADGKQLYYRALGHVMVVDVTTTPAFAVGAPQVLFRIPANGATPGVSRDGQRMVVGVRMDPPERKVVAIAPETLATYAGTYARPYQEGELVVTVQGTQLMVQSAPVYAESETYFFRRTPVGDVDFEFVKDETGAVTHVIRYTGEYWTPWERK